MVSIRDLFSIKTCEEYNDILQFISSRFWKPEFYKDV